MELHDQTPAPNEEMKPQSVAAEAADATVNAIEEANTDATLTAEDQLAAITAELPDEEAVAADLTAVEAPAAPLTKDDILARLRQLADNDAADLTTEEMGRIKQQFYQLKNEETRASRDLSLIHI